MKKLVLIGVLFVAAVLGWATQVNVTLKSDTNVMVYGPIDHYLAPNDPGWGTSKYAAVVAWPHPLWPYIANSAAVWISDSYMITGDPVNDSWRKFEATLKIPCVAYNVGVGSATVNSDNAEEVYLNGVLIGSDGNVQGPIGGYEWYTERYYPLLNLAAGLNKLEFIVRNYAGDPDDVDNPTGLIFQVTGLTYEIPEVVWRPPIINKKFVLQNGSTLPIKFSLYLQDGTQVTGIKNVELRVYKGTCNELTEPPVATWYLGEGVNNLRSDPNGLHYIANFHTRNYSLEVGAMYSAVVFDGCTQEPLGCISFLLSRKGNRSNK